MQISTLLKALKGGIIKRYIDLCFMFGISPGKKGKGDIVVSLTSYGRRVSDCVPYTIYWMFKQSEKPARIILWLDDVNWSEDNIPWRLKFLIKHGLEVRYCKDIKSFKKLVYTLQLCSDSRIVTADDDMLYSLSMIKYLKEMAEHNPDSIIALRFHQPVWDDVGKSFKPYHMWSNPDEASLRIPPMPTTGGGVMFPPHCFSSDACNESAFMKLCPNADDVWFWAMAIYSERTIFATKKDVIFPIDAFYQYFHKGSALEHENVENSGNDKQINAVFDFYNLWDKLK